MDAALQRLGRSLAGKLRFREPLARYTTWRIGGLARAFVTPGGLDDVRRVIEFVNEHRVPLHVLGRGSNVLVDDAGLPGIMLYMAKSFQQFEVIGSTLRVGAGVALPKLAKVAAENSYTGFEFLVGIPGTVGAGVLINAGAGGYEISDLLGSVTLLDREGNLERLSVAEMEYGHRSSAYLKAPVVVTEALFRLEKRRNRDQIQGLMQEFIEKRRKEFPLTYPNAGSTFVRPDGGAGPPAGWLLEKAGMKGRRVGDAQVSELHANFIINLGQASSEDVKTLVRIMHQAVLDVHGIDLDRENIFLPEEHQWFAPNSAS